MRWENVKDRKIIVLSVLLAISGSGCTSILDEIHPSYVSPRKYLGYSCTEMDEEYIRVSERIDQIYVSHEEKKITKLSEKVELSTLYGQKLALEDRLQNLGCWRHERTKY